MSYVVASWIADPQPPMAKGQSGPERSFTVFEAGKGPDLSDIKDVEFLYEGDPDAQFYIDYAVSKDRVFKVAE